MEAAATWQADGNQRNTFYVSENTTACLLSMRKNKQLVETRTTRHNRDCFRSIAACSDEKRKQVCDESTLA